MKHKYTLRKMIGLVVDLAMYLILILQMVYVITGNTVHEWLGMGFFLCLVIHMVIKRRWFGIFYRRKGNVPIARVVADACIVLLLLLLVLLMVSSMGVSRLLFPYFQFLGSPVLHRTLATFALAVAVIHGSMHGYLKSRRKRRVVILMALGVAISLGLGFGLVPWLNRHMRVVEIPREAKTSEKPCHWSGEKPLVVYFTRVGNTDFEADVDAVSGASLLLADGELTGNTQWMTEALTKWMDCDTAAITLTGEKYPSSYAETCSVGGVELKNHARPAIEPIDITAYNDIILVYPIWWGTIPMPVATFLEENDFAGKQVWLLATQGSSGFASSTGDIRQMIPQAQVEEGISIYCDDIPNSEKLIGDWLTGNLLVE